MPLEEVDAADLDLAPAGFPAQGEEHAVVEEFRPAEASNESFGLMTAPTISERRRPPAKPRSKIVRSRKFRKLDGGRGVEHGQDMLREERLLLDGRPCICAANAGEDVGDMAVFAVEGQGRLGENPGERRERGLDRGDGPWPAACARAAPEARAP